MKVTLTLVDGRGLRGVMKKVRAFFESPDLLVLHGQVFGVILGEAQRKEGWHEPKLVQKKI